MNPEPLVFNTDSGDYTPLSVLNDLAFYKRRRSRFPSPFGEGRIETLRTTERPRLGKRDSLHLWVKGGLKLVVVHLWQLLHEIPFTFG